MSMRVPIQDQNFVTLISVYAPTLQAETSVKETYYRHLHNLLQHVNSKDKLVILDDFNASVGSDFELWKGVLGKHGLGNYNDRLLLQFCAEHELSISNTLFQQKNRFKCTSQHPRSKHWHLLDYISTRQRDVSDA